MLAHLVDAGIRSLLLAIPAAIVLWILRRRRTAALQHAVWTAVVCGMLALFVFGKALPRLPLRILDDAAVPPPIALDVGAVVPSHDLGPPPLARQASRPQARPIGWQEIAVFAYVAVSLGFFSQFVTAMILVRKLLATARAIPEVDADRAYESEAIAVPVTVGWLRPSILLPLEWREWDGEKLEAVLAHEGAHARRRDGLVAAIAGLNRCVLWFHPLAWILQRKLALLAEQACDEACVAAIGDQQRYARLLLEMAGMVDGTLGRLRYHALTMAAVSHIRQRIDSLLRPGQRFSRGLSWAGWTAVVLCGIPATFAAGTVQLDRQPPLLQLTVPRWAAPAAPPSEVLLAQVRPRPIQSAQAQAAPQQSVPSVIPRFDSVTVKPCGPNDGAGRSGRGGAGGRGFPISPPGELYVNCMSVLELINHSLDNGNERLLNDPGSLFDPQRIRGGPAWISTDYYTIDAKSSDPAVSESATPGSSARRLVHGPMLQAILEDRFQLRTRRIVEEVPMYSLIVAGSGFLLQPMQEGACIPHDPSKGTFVSQLFPPGQKPLCVSHIGFHGPNWTFRSAGQPFGNLPRRLGSLLDRPVLDKTGITATIIFQLEFARDQNAPGNFPPSLRQPPEDPSVPLGPTIFAALEQIGLKLVDDKGPREFLVIDSVQRPR